MAATKPDEGIKINGVAHVILRARRIAECIEFYDQVMPFLGLKAVPPRSDLFVYYVGGRTALAIREADPDHAGSSTSRPGPASTTSAFGRAAGGCRRRPECQKGIGADIVRAPEEGPWAPGYYSLSFRDPEGIRLELNHVPGPGLLAEGASFDPAPDHPNQGSGPTRMSQPRPEQDSNLRPTP